MFRNFSVFRNTGNRNTRRWFLFHLLLAVPVFFLARIHKSRKDGLVSAFAVPSYSLAGCGGGWEPLPYTATEKVMLTIQKNTDGSVSDVTPEEQVVEGRLLRQANGRTYRAFYWINNVRWQHPDGTPRLLDRVPLPAGQLVHLKKVWAEDGWALTFDQLYLKQPEAWYEKKGADAGRTFKTITAVFTT